MISNKLKPYNVFIFHVDRKSKNTATIVHCTRVWNLFSETTNMLEQKLIASVKTNLVWNWNQIVLHWINMNGINIILSRYGWRQDFATKWTKNLTHVMVFLGQHLRDLVPESYYIQYVIPPTTRHSKDKYIQWLLGTNKIFSFALGQNITYLSIIHCW